MIFKRDGVKNQHQLIENDVNTTQQLSGLGKVFFKKKLMIL